MNVEYALEPTLDCDEMIDLIRRSTLSRPVEERRTMQGMIQHADILLTARIDRQLVGISRAISDFSYCTYLSDLAVDQAHQRRGIGRELVRRTHETAGLHTALILLAAPAARTYYPHIGMTPHESCWMIKRRPR